MAFAPTECCSRADEANRHPGSAPVTFEAVSGALESIPGPRDPSAAPQQPHTAAGAACAAKTSARWPT